MSSWNPQANDLFLQAAEIESAAERKEFLERNCAGDAALREQVEALLAASAKAGSFLNRPAVPAGGGTVDYHSDERPGSLLGSYKLLQQIGEGGFGEVFMAEQQEPVRRKVAIKILKPGMDSRESLPASSRNAKPWP